ncbi:hypothetical protein RM530_15550 [Algiphilus sp. W345]|uniref:Phosphatidate cytidylyltransferase n=1 Tax=Banduia mediterranea TaxID=3075609 RepID=A0ABU2WMB9_9GAMM|nr:hypothetical protein [Algiphilus sp. W345]MDT0498764.1 hypothetical protein [Algiphilus sp. W345]
MSDTIESLLDAELGRDAPEAAVELARQLGERSGGGAAAVLFYGSALRDAALDGVLDFYILLDRCADWPAPATATLANRLLPPNVGYIETELGGQTLRTKYAVMSLAQFRKAMSVRAVDTTLWARFSQPSVCLYARSESDRQDVRDAVRAATLTAAQWAAALGPERGKALDYWRALYARTYQAELRVERSDRGADLVARDAARYAALLPAAWRAAGVDFDQDGDWLLTRFSPAERTAAGRRWALRQRLGRPLNALRLIKAAGTFDNGMDYIAWKVERHSGYRMEPTEFQRRHPVLAAPALYLRLRRNGVLR